MNHVTSDRMDPAVKFLGMKPEDFNGRMFRHTESRHFYVASDAIEEGCWLRRCQDPNDRYAYRNRRFRTWEQLARIYNLVPLSWRPIYPRSRWQTGCFAQFRTLSTARRASPVRTFLRVLDG